MIVVDVVRNTAPPVVIDDISNVISAVYLRRYPSINRNDLRGRPYSGHCYTTLPARPAVHVVLVLPHASLFVGVRRSSVDTVSPAVVWGQDVCA